MLFHFGRTVITGTVLRSVGGSYEVGTADGVVTAILRGRLKVEARTGDKVVVGDRVSVSEPGRPDEPWAIEGVEERRSALVRRAPGKAPRPKIIVANVDQVVIVFAVANPEPNLRMLDRFLVLAEASDLEAVIVVNKAELEDDSVPRAAFDVYGEIGYRLLWTSAKRDEGIDELRDVLCGSLSALAGPSGVGKSSLLNQVQPGLGLRVGAVSSAVRKGQHTTVSADLIELDCGGYVADTPGLREVGLWDVDPAYLDHCFPEFVPFLGECRYGNSCSHSHEPGCAVAAAVGESISEARYESYLKLLEEE